MESGISENGVHPQLAGRVNHRLDSYGAQGRGAPDSFAHYHRKAASMFDGFANAVFCG